MVFPFSSPPHTIHLANFLSFKTTEKALPQKAISHICDLTVDFPSAYALSISTQHPVLRAQHSVLNTHHSAPSTHYSQLSSQHTNCPSLLFLLLAMRSLSADTMSYLFFYLQPLAWLHTVDVQLTNNVRKLTKFGGRSGKGIVPGLQ